MDAKEKRFWEAYYGEDYFQESEYMPSRPIAEAKDLIAESEELESQPPDVPNHRGMTIPIDVLPFDPTVDDPSVFKAFEANWAQGGLDTDQPDSRKRMREAARQWVRDLNNSKSPLQQKPGISE